MYYICALYDDRRQGGFPQLFTTDTAALERFAKRWDRPGMSVYQCVSTLQPNAQRRARDTVAEMTALHVDIDMRMLATSPEVVRQKLLELSLSVPVEIRSSGGGYHVIVELKEPARAGTPEFERANKVRGALTRMLCGDPAPDHHAALLRKVGTHNTKYGEPRLCQVEKAGAPVDITDLEAFIELYDGKPQFEWAPKLNGHAQKPEREERERENGFDDNPCAELNTAALKNLEAWVTALLPDAKRRKGRYPAYDAVNPSRPSSTGRPYEQRNRNLGIVGSGIKDFGTGRGYSPLDLVMAVRDSSLAEAFCWLEEKLLPQKPDIEIDLDKIIEAQESPSISPETDDGGSDDGDASGESYPEMEKDLEVLGTPWFLGEPLPDPKPMTVPYFVPSRAEPCIGYIGAVTGSVKTFTADDLAVAISSGGTFAGQQVTERGAVVLIEMEGSSRVRLKASVQYRGVEEVKLPIFHFQKMPPVILHKGETSKEWKDWCIRMVRLVRWICERKWGVPLTAIILDPLAHFSGITDIGSFSENTVVSKALIELALRAACLVIVVDHYGKDTTRGLIGSIARESLAYFVLTPGDKLGADLSKPRQLVVRKMRDGMNNICVDYRVHVWDTKAKQIVDGESFDIPLEDQARRTLVIEWGKEIRRWSESEDDAGGDSLTPNQRVVLNKINELLNSEGVEPPAECGALAGMRAIRWTGLWPRLRARGLTQTGLSRARTDLLAKGLIGVHEDWIWITLTGD